MQSDASSLGAVVFDFYGVLVGGPDNQQARLAHAARRVGMAPDQFSSFLRRGEAFERMHQGRGSREEWWAERMAALDITDESVARRLYDQLFDPWTIDPRCSELIEQLGARGVRLALLSNGGSSATRLAERYPILKSFERLFLSGEMGFGKPSPAAFQNVEHTLALPPASLLLIDDSRTHTTAARKRGWQVHVYQSFDLLQEELKAWGLLS